jgi:hypothetical protein
VIRVDRVGAAFLGLWDSDALARELGGHRTSPLLEVAAKRFGVDIADPAVTGDGAALVAAKRPAHLVGMANFTIDDDAPESTPHLHAAHVAVDEAPKGVADEVWDKAEPLRFTTDWSGADAGVATEVRALWSERGLYLRWDLAGAGLNTDRTRPIDVERVNLYEEDTTEVFLTPDASQPKRYFEIEVGPFGHWYDIAVDRSGTPGAKRADDGWSAGLAIATARDEAAHTATIEYAITAPEVVSILKAGVALPLGLDRMEGTSPRLYLAAFPTRTPKPNFHVPESFGRLLLDP